MSDCFSELRVAVVGFGSIGRRHAENLERLGVQRITIVRRSHDRNPAFTPPAEAVIVDSPEVAIAGGLDLAVICNPTSLHLTTAEPFVRAGVPVLIEKPLATDLSQAQAALPWLSAATTPIGVAYCLRYHPAYRAARDALLDGRIGEVQSARAWFESYLPDWHPWEDYRTSYAARPELGGGVLPTLDHELDYLLWCLGEPVEARGRSWRSGQLDMPADDSAEIALRFGNNISADVQLSMSQPQRSRGFELIGARGSFRFDWATGQLNFAASGATCVEELLWNNPDWDVNAMYLDLLADALDAMRTKMPFPVPWQAGWESLKVIAALERHSSDMRNSGRHQVPTPKAGVFA
jgi:predicted dehydrogenase